MSKPVVPRVLAEDDLDRACDPYLATAGIDVAVDFLSDFDRAIGHISQFPETGSPRYGYEPGLAGIRFWPMTKFPFLIFYIETEHQIDVWRVMHGGMDITAELQDPGSVP
ncbi:MAG: type II toxin-antitoxin system RelE/ParE family toxin [Acidobacteria bacterium]|nr:type II toxin-antitoxin system RelE/ParE family toxin [Acidobacteriota bacterium]